MWMPWVLGAWRRSCLLKRELQNHFKDVKIGLPGNVQRYWMQGFIWKKN